MSDGCKPHSFRVVTLPFPLWILVTPSCQSSMSALGCTDTESGAQLRLVFRWMLPPLTHLAGKSEKHQAMAAHIAVEIYYQHYLLHSSAMLRNPYINCFQFCYIFSSLSTSLEQNSAALQRKVSVSHHSLISPCQKS